MVKHARIAGKERFEIHESAFRVKGNPLIRVTHVGVCGTDLTTWKEGDSYIGLIPGHEYSGIIEVPGNSGLFEKGDRVAGYTQNVHNEACGHCADCLAGRFDGCANRAVHTWKGGEMNHPGAYSEYTTWFPRSIYKLPDTLDQEEGALIEPFTVGLHAVQLAGIRPGDKVLVLGGGIIALSICEWAAGRGVSTLVVTERNSEKIRLIREFGLLEHVLSADDPDLVNMLLDLSDGGFDVVFDCVGQASTINTGIAAMKKEFYKTIVAVGLPHDMQNINYREIVLRQILVRGSKGHSYAEFETTANALARRAINAKQYISTRFRFADIQGGFETLKARNGADIKAVVDLT